MGGLYLVGVVRISEYRSGLLCSVLQIDDCTALVSIDYDSHIHPMDACAGPTLAHAFIS